MSTSEPTSTQSTQQSKSSRGQTSIEQLPGWLTFSGTILAIGGVFGIIDGIAMVGESKIYLAGTEYMFGNLNAWGWTFIVLGAFQILVALGVFAASRLAIATGVVLASLYIIAELIASAHFPLWSLILIGFQVMVIFGLIRGNSELHKRTEAY